MKLSMFMLLLLCVCVAILTSLLVYSQHRSDSNSMPDNEHERLAREANALQLQVNQLLTEQVRLSEELRAKDAQLAARAEAALTTNQMASANPAPGPFNKPYYAKAFLDGEYVGLAQVSPVFRTDKETGQTIFENIINLSGDARSAVVKTVTNVVERDVVRNTTLNHNYAQQPYWYGYPVWVRPNPTNGIPGRPAPTPPIQRPPNTGSGQFVRSDGTPYWQNGGVWKPETIRKNPSR